MMIEYETGQYPEGWETLWAEQAELHRQPVREVVRVVRCKDCKYAEWLGNFDPSIAQYFCEFMNANVELKGDDFCSKGKRRDNIERKDGTE